MKTNNLLIIAVVTAMIISCNSQKTGQVSVVPMPVQLEQKPGFFRLHPSAQIGYSGGKQAESVARQLAEIMRPSTGYALDLAEGNKADINLVLDTSLTMKPEEYRLTVERKKVTLTSDTPAGLFRGIQTIRQLLPPSIESDTAVAGVRWIIPCVTISDFPRFAWRGMHLDVSRHFFDVAFIKKYIDILALHKMNVFHWHLVDDQGWRIEIKKYPRLTEVGAWRVDREDKPWDARPPQQPGEKATYGGFYTQDQIREIVAYAAERFITVVPEIEMPAHVGSALAAYPEYSCTGGPFTVPPGGVWPITDIYCAGKDETFTFLEDILTEVIDLFPSAYIHIGGDEADKTEWKKCPYCQARIKKEGLHDEAELQSWFVRQIERFLNSKGRKLIGWDEILQGGLAPEATVMSWQGFEGGIAAARSGHDAVMTPSSYCYFNVYQGDPASEPTSFRGLLTLKKVYSFEPVPATLNTDEARHIIGAQGCLWTEYVTDGDKAEHMLLPRLTALSEVVWTPAEKRSWDDFSLRLRNMMDRFDIMKLNYSKGSFHVDMSASYDEASDRVMLEMTSEQPSPEIRYTTDGTEPGPASPLYEGPLPMTETATVRAAIFTDGVMTGRPGEKKIDIHKALGKKVTYNIPFSDKYKAFGDRTLVNGIRGGGAFDDGQWQGFEGTDMDVMVDLGNEMPVTSVSTSFMSSTGSWIFLPRSVTFSISSDGKEFSQVHEIMTDIKPEDQGSRINEYFASFPEETARYVRVFAHGLITCPPWHAGAGGKAWMFCDEIIVE